VFVRARSARVRHLNRLLLISGVASRASSIREWLYPLKDIPSLGYDYLPSLVSSLKTSAEGLPEISKALVTTLRILKHLAVPPEQPTATEGKSRRRRIVRSENNSSKGIFR